MYQYYRGNFDTPVEPLHVVKLADLAHCMNHFFILLFFPCDIFWLAVIYVIIANVPGVIVIILCTDVFFGFIRLYNLPSLLSVF